MDAADPPAVPVTLAIPVNGSTPTGGATLEIAGQRWLLTDYSDAAHAPGYTCISYSWGTARTAHPWSPEVLISARALAVMEVTCKAVQQTAIWLDALCIPFGDAERSVTLRSMGAIYARAAQVVVVLSPECASAIGEIAATRKLSEASLGGLEHDAWVTRAWTYQECANSAAVRFCVEGGGTASVVGDDLLNALGQALSDYRKTHGVDAFELSKLLPGLDGLESTLADWMLSGTAERMAYQVMVGVELRSPGMSAEDRLDAMIGAVDPEYAAAHASPAIHPATLFVQACAAKGDFSFIYTTAERSTKPGQTWQPLPGELRPVLAWHTYGDGQSGDLLPDHVDLRGMTRAVRGPLGPESAQFIAQWLGVTDPPAPDEMSRRVLNRLRQMGFTGVGEPVELEQGLFFPQHTPPPDTAEILIATGVLWVHGAPGLVLLPADNGGYAFCDVGVVVGPTVNAQEIVSVV